MRIIPAKYGLTQGPYLIRLTACPPGEGRVQILFAHLPDPQRGAMVESKNYENCSRKVEQELNSQIQRQAERFLDCKCHQILH